MTAGFELAWFQLVKQKGHLLAAIAGVAFAVALMFIQVGLRDALLLSSTDLYKHLNADLVMTSWEYAFQQGAQYFPQARAVQVLSTPGVQTAEPVWISLQPFENPETHRSSTITVVAFKPTADVWQPENDHTSFQALSEPDTVLFDAESREVFGRMNALLAAHTRVPVLVTRHLVDVVGHFRLMPSFGTDGFVFTSDQTYRSIIHSPALSEPVVCAIRLRAGADPATVLSALRANLPNDVKFTTKDAFVEAEKRYWLEASAVGVIFTALLGLAITVGAVVVYQILYTDVTNHLPEYATMKAMGYADRKLITLILLQSMYISLLGFAFGALVSQLIYLILRHATLLPLAHSLPRMLEVYAMTLTMCVVSGSLAMLALRNADPAEIF